MSETSTDPVEQVAAVEAGGGPITQPSPRARRNAKIIAAIVGPLLVAAAIAWPVAAQTSRESLTLSMDAKPIRCIGTTPVISHDSGTYTWAIPLDPTFTCEVRVHIHNGGLFPVTITSARYTWLGPDSVTAHAISIDSQPTRGDTETDGNDAIGHLQNPEIAPGDSYTLTARVVRAKTTCYANEGGGVYFADSPVLGVTSLGIHGERSSGSVRFGFVGTKTSFDDACNDPDN